MPDPEEGLVASRNVKLDRIRGNGIDPYPPRFNRTCSAAAAITQLEAWENGPSEEPPIEELSLAGRIISVRAMGRASFVDLQDGSGVIQALLRENVLGEAYTLLRDLDVGDHLGVTGTMMRTRTGQATIEAHNLTLTAKGMRPLPEKYHGLRDVETRYRQRYLDLIANPRGHAGLRPAQPDHHCHSQLFGRPRVSGSGHPNAGARSRRSQRPAFHNSP